MSLSRRNDAKVECFGGGVARAGVNALNIGLRRAVC